jgi:hypothetical protein
MNKGVNGREKVFFSLPPLRGITIRGECNNGSN